MMDHIQRFGERPPLIQRGLSVRHADEVRMQEGHAGPVCPKASRRRLALQCPWTKRLHGTVKGREKPASRAEKRFGFGVGPSKMFGWPATISQERVNWEISDEGKNRVMQSSTMKRGVNVVMSVLLAFTMSWTSPPGAAGEPAAARADLAHPSRLLVRFRPGIARTDRQAVHRTAGAKGVLKEFRVVPGLQLVEMPEDGSSATLATYQSQPEVLYAEPDYCIWTTELPTDPDFSLLWGLQNTGQTVDGVPGTPGADIGAVDAWNFWTGDPSFRVAVADTGVDYDHSDLHDNMWTNIAELNGTPDVDDDGNGYVDDVHGYDFFFDDPDPMDDRTHGSHVAGTIGAVANNGEGVAGVNWECKIVSLKIFGPDVG